MTSGPLTFRKGTPHTLRTSARRRFLLLFEISMTSTAPCPEIQEVGTRNRPWSIGSHLLGHYDSQRPGGEELSAAFSQPPSYSPSSGVIDIHNGTTPGAEYQGLNRTGSSSNGLTSRPTSSQSGDAISQDQRPLIRTSTTFYERVLTDWWWWELFSLFVSFSCVSAIIGVLAFYDGKRQPDFVIPGITLNAFVALFAAVAKAALILPVSEAIGQLKWMWFKKDSKLWDFFTFDGASRGPWGSLMLLKTTKGSYVSGRPLLVIS